MVALVKELHNALARWTLASHQLPKCTLGRRTPRTAANLPQLRVARLAPTLPGMPQGFGGSHRRRRRPRRCQRGSSAPLDRPAPQQLTVQPPGMQAPAWPGSRHFQTQLSCGQQGVGAQRCLAWMARQAGTPQALPCKPLQEIRHLSRDQFAVEPQRRPAWVVRQAWVLQALQCRRLPGRRRRSWAMRRWRSC